MAEDSRRLVFLASLLALYYGLAGCATLPRRGTAKNPEKPAAAEVQPADPLLLVASCS